MSKKLQTLIQNTIGDGARAAKYMMTIDRLPGNSSTWPVQSKSLSIMCKGAIFPGKNLTTITYLYKGRNIVIPSHVKYNQTFELTFYLNESHNARIAFSDWMQGFDQSYESYYTGTNVGAANSAGKDIINSGSSFTENVRDAKTDLDRMTSIKVAQLNFDNTQKTAEYIFHNCYPTAISDITTDASSVGAILEYTVTFAYSHMLVLNPSDTSYPFGILQ